MNTNSNTYTVIYSAILVIVVAAVLAFVAMFLKPSQEKNVKEETISQILNAASIEIENNNVLGTYSAQIASAILVNGNGEKVGELATDLKNIKVYTTSELKRQTKIAEAREMKLPVYIFNNGITVVPCYGAGLWGPIWGYIGFNSDLKTISKAVFDHKSETPGLGAKITEEPFRSQFAGKQVGAGETAFAVVKAGTPVDNNSVNAISGATITSQSMGRTLDQWFTYYKPYFSANAAVEAPVEATSEETVNNVEE